MSLEAVTEEPHHHYSSFRVGGKIFVSIPPEEDVIHVFVGDEDRDQALAMYPEFVEKLFWGGKAVGLRLVLASARPTVLRSLVNRAYETRVIKDAGAKAAVPGNRKAGP